MGQYACMYDYNPAVGLKEYRKFRPEWVTENVLVNTKQIDN